MSTAGLIDWIRGLIAPLFVGGTGIIAVFFLFTREITRFAQFLVLAVAVAIVFYTPGIVEVTAKAITAALGVR